MVLRRSLVLLLALLSIGVASCGDADPPTQVSAGSDPAEATTTEAADASTTVATSTTAVIASTTTATAPATTTTSAVPPPSGPAAPSPVDGLDAAQLQAALALPVGTSARSASGPTVDQVALPGGTRVWRVRVPGDFTARSARVSISVGGRTVGEGVLSPDLAAITAVTTDGSGLSAGRPVTYRWEGGSPIAAGNLAVAR